MGRAIAARRKKDGWTGRFTAFSRHTHILEQLKRDYPDVNIVQGDICDYDSLYRAMAGHDVVIHAGAVKVIPVSEEQSIDTIRVNVQGSLNVCSAAVHLGVKDVLGISTDKACHPANAYGATKYLMEKTFQEYSRMEFWDTKFHLVRYGNVLESNGSVVEAWKRSVARGEPIKMTNPNMTRFWISPSQAVDYVITAMQFESGCIYIPRMKALSIGKLAEYTVGNNVKIERIPLRAGEKIHETLLTLEEGWYALGESRFYLLYPTTHKKFGATKEPYTSQYAEELTRDELAELLKNG